LIAAPSTERKVALGLLAAAMAASAALLFYFGRGQTIRGDDLEYAARLSTQGLGHALLHTPPNKYLIAVPLLVYKAMFEIFGLTSYLPYRIVGIALTLACAGLFFLLARRRIGDLLALPPTLILLFFGAGYEEVMTAIRLPSLIAIACGLGSLLLLERGDLRGDVVSAILLSIAVASHPTGVAFTAGAAILILFRPAPERWRRLWVVAAPAAIFGAWWLFWRAPSTATAFPTRPSDAFLFVRQSWVMVTAVVTGLSGVLDRPVYRDPIAEAAGALLFALVALAVALRFRRLRPSFWAILATFVVLLVSTRLSPGGFLRYPDEPRYMFPEAILFLLLLVELAGPAALPRSVAGVAAVILLLGAWSNLDQLRDAGPIVRLKSEVVKGELSAYEIAGPKLDPGYTPTPGRPSAGQDLDAIEAYGSPALSPEELQHAAPITRSSADDALVGSMGVRPHPVSHGSPASGPAPWVEQLYAARANRRPGCVRIAPQQQATDEAPSRLAQLILPPAGVEVSARDLSTVRLFLGQFMVPPTVPLPEVEGRTAELRIPSDGASIPWRLAVAANAPVSVCGLPEH
jgi:hypothetical protein